MLIGMTSAQLNNLDSFKTLFAGLPDLTAIDASVIDEQDQQNIIIYTLEAYLALPSSAHIPALILAADNCSIQTLQGTIQAWRKGAVGVWFLNELPANLADKVSYLSTHIEKQKIANALPTLTNLQQRIQPKPTSINDQFSIHTQLVAAEAMCGDWIEYWQPNPDTLLFFLADVSGHGLVSSFFTPWLSACRNRFNNLNDLVNALNTQLYEFSVSQHISILAGMINAKTGQLDWCNAGHYPPGIIIQPNQPPLILNSDGLALGLNPKAQVTIHSTHISSKAQILFASDGVIELFSGSLEQRMQQFLSTFRNHTLELPPKLEDDVSILEITLA